MDTISADVFYFMVFIILFYLQLPVTVIKEGWRVCGSCMLSVIESADVPPLLLYSPISTGSSPPLSHYSIRYTVQAYVGTSYMH